MLEFKKGVRRRPFFHSAVVYSLEEEPDVLLSVTDKNGESFGVREQSFKSKQ